VFKFIKAFVAVFWGFLGVRKSEDHKKDLANLELKHLIVAGLFGVLFFVSILLILVNLIVA
tara:strand:+ start:1971 stop:2153 length:183 start_codon:yes stop_codon:yes gene_type:complete